jgi:hypothetical protein
MKNKTTVILIGLISSLIVIGLMFSLALAIFTQNNEAMQLIGNILTGIWVTVSFVVSLYFLRK